MRKQVLSIAFAAILTGPVMAENAEIKTLSYLEAIAQVDLNEQGDYGGPPTFAGLFHDIWYAVHDEEHGWKGAESVAAFDALLTHDARSDTIDRDVIAPWLLRYIWAGESTEGRVEAWRTFLLLGADDALELEAALHLLRHHPGGALRAAVASPGEHIWATRPLDYIENPRFQALLAEAVQSDPAPAVRIAAMDALAIYEFDTLTDLAKTRAQADPAAEVRARALRILSQDASAESRALLVEALEAEENAFVLPGVLRSLMRQGSVLRAPDLEALGANALAKYRDHVLAGDMISAVGWQIPESLVPIALAGAPFEDGAAWITYLEGIAKDPAQPPAERAKALVALAKYEDVPFPHAEFLEIFFDPSTDRDVFAIYSDMLHRGVYARVFVERGITPESVDLLGQMIAHLGEADPANPDEFLRGDRVILGPLMDLAVRLALHRFPFGDMSYDAAPYMDLIENVVMTHPIYLGNGLFGLRHASEAQLSAERLADWFENARSDGAAFGVAEIAAIRLKNDPNDRQVAAMVRIVNGMAERLPKGGYIYQHNDVLRELPNPQDLDDSPELRSQLAAAIRSFAKELPEGTSTYGFDRWLED